MIFCSYICKSFLKKHIFYSKWFKGYCDLINPEVSKIKSQVINLYYKNKCLFCILTNQYSFQSSKGREAVLICIKDSIFIKINNLISE